MQRKTLAWIVALFVFSLTFGSLPSAFPASASEMAVTNVGNIDAPDKWTAGPPRWVNTNEFIFYTNETYVNDTFYLGMILYDAIDVFAWQLKLWFNASLVHCTSVWKPGFHIFAGRMFLDSEVIIDNEAGYVVVGCALLMGQQTFTGSGTLCQIGFKIMEEPNVTEPLLACSFRLDHVDTWLLDSNMNTLSITMTDGYYEFYCNGRLMGDCDGNGRVDMRDIAEICMKFGAVYPDPPFEVWYDLYQDGVINMRDIAVACQNFGETFTP